MPWGGARPGAGRRAKPKDGKAVTAKPAAEPKKRTVLDGSAMQVIADALTASARRADRKPELNPFQLPKFPAKAMPPARLRLAMDSSELAPINWAASEWATGFPGAMAAEGLTFLGFPYLSELAQVPEYRTFGEIIATEMTRKWVEFKGTGGEGKKSNADEEGKTLRSEAIADKIKALKDELDRLEVRDRYAELARQDSWFGRTHLFYDFKGADLDDTRGELASDIGDGLNEVSKSKIGKGALQRLQVVEPVWTYPTTYNTTNPLKEDWYNPQVWYCMGKQVHRSRLPAFIGRPVPDLLKPSYAFGGLSLSQLAKPYVDIWRVTRESVGELIHSFSVMVLLTDLSTMLQPGGAGDLLARVALFNALRDNQGAFVVNKDTEDFKNVSASLSGLHELQSQAQEHMMSVARIPAVKYTGMQPTGLNASSEGEIRAFYDTINAHQGFFFRPELTKTIRFAQLSLWGEVDPDITWDFVPLWELSDKEKADKRKTDADAGKVYIEGGVISPEEERARIASDPESGYHGLNPEDVPEPPPDEDEDLGGGPGGGDDPPGGGKKPGGAAADAVVPFAGAGDEAGFQESKHPRDKGGKFAETAGGGSSGTEAPAFKSKKDHVAHLLKEGTTAAEILKATGWPSVSVPQQAFAAKMKLEKYNEGGVTKYKGTPMTDAEYAAAKEAVKAKKAEKLAPLNKAGGFAPPTPAPESVTKKIAEQALKDNPGMAAAVAASKPATAEELEKAKSKYPLGAHILPHIDKKELDAFNNNWAGEQAPKTPGQLQAKVSAFKVLKAKNDVIAAKAQEESEAQEAEQKKKQAAELAKAKSTLKTLMGELGVDNEADAVAVQGLMQMLGTKNPAEFVAKFKAPAGEMAHHGVTAFEMSMLKSYTGSSYAAVNSALRQGSWSLQQHMYVNAVNKALKKLPSYTGTSRRGTTLSAEQQALYVAGNVVEERAFTSTSKNTGWDGNTKYVIQGKSGRDVQSVSLHKSEAEVLYPARSFFRVSKVDGKPGGTMTVHLTEVEAW